MLLEPIIPTVEARGNVEEALSMTIASGFNRWNFKSTICPKPI